MKLASITRYIEVATSRLDELADRARTVPDSGRPIVQESLLHLASTLEELRVSEEELRAQAEGLAQSNVSIEAEMRRYRDLFDAAPDAYLVTNADAVIREGNRAAGALLGVHPESLRGKPLAVFVPEEDRRVFRRQLHSLRLAAQPDGWELWLLPRDREPVRVEVTVVPGRGGEGEPPELRMTLRDVSRRARTEAPPVPLPQPQAAPSPSPTASAALHRPEAEVWGKALIEEVRGAVAQSSRAAAPALAGVLRDAIARALYLGTLLPGDRVPGIREVSRATRLNHKVVARAYRALVTEGTLEVRDRSGVYVGRQGWSDREPPGDTGWLAEVLVEAWRRGIGIAALPELVRRWSAAARLRCACVESDAARRAALCAELGSAFALECVPVALEGHPAGEAAPALAGAVAGADLVVTTPFHAGRIRALARAQAKPLLVVTAPPESAAAGSVPLPRLSADTARMVSETVVMLNRERHPDAGAESLAG